VSKYPFKGIVHPKIKIMPSFLQKKIFWKTSLYILFIKWKSVGSNMLFWTPLSQYGKNLLLCSTEEIKSLCFCIWYRSEFLAHV